MIAARPVSSDQIKSFRAAHGISQERLGQLLGVSGRKTVHQWETGAHRPPAMLSLALAALDTELRPRGVYEASDAVDPDTVIAVSNKETRRVEIALKVSPTQSRFLVAMHKANGMLTSRDLDQVTPVSESLHRRKDPEYRTLTTIRTLMYDLRKKIGRDKIASRVNGGYWLTDAGRELVASAL